MKRILLILLVFAVSCIILSQGGCERSKKSAPAVQTPAKSVVVEEKAPAGDKPAVEPVTPKPAADKPVRMVEKPAPKPDDGKGPRIKFDKLIHNFGDIDPGSNNICEFPFKNVGNALLKEERILAGGRRGYEIQVYRRLDAEFAEQERLCYNQRSGQAQDYADSKG